MTEAQPETTPAPTLPLALLRHLPVVLLGALYLVVIGLKAARSGLWFDEITTFYVSNLGSAAAIVDALLGRADNHPPLDYLARHFSMSVLGSSEFAFLLPSVLAMLVASASLYIFVLRRTSVLPALVAFVFPLITFALRYSYEGRPYALLIMSMCLALLAWQLATEKPTIPRLVFLTLCLSLGPHVHYYGVLNYVPLAAGEIWRWWERRAISWAIVGCVVVSFAIDALLVPFALHASDFAVHFWTRVGPGEAVFLYGRLLEDAVPPLLAAAVGCAFLAYFFRGNPEPGTDAPAIPRHELIAALMLCLVPVTTFVLKWLVTHAYADKYLINTVVGVAMILAYLTARLRARRPAYAVVIALAVALWGGWKLAYMGRYLPSKPYALPAEIVQLFEAATQPIAVFSAHKFLETHFYLPRHLRDKIYYLTDPKLSINYAGHDTNEIVIRNLQSIVSLPMVKLCEFTKTHPRFLMLVVEPTWVVPQLIKDGAALTLIDGTTQQSQVISVSLTQPSGC